MNERYEDTKKKKERKEGWEEGRKERKDGRNETIKGKKKGRKKEKRKKFKGIGGGRTDGMKNENETEKKMNKENRK